MIFQLSINNLNNVFTPAVSAQSVSVEGFVLKSTNSTISAFLSIDVLPCSTTWNQTQKSNP